MLSILHNIAFQMHLSLSSKMRFLSIYTEKQFWQSDFSQTPPPLLPVILQKRFSLRYDNLYIPFQNTPPRFHC